jgi:hypothetical protein
MPGFAEGAVTHGVGPEQPFLFAVARAISAACCGVCVTYAAGHAERWMSPRAHYVHWLRVALWPVPILTLLKAGRAATSAARRRM